MRTSPILTSLSPLILTVRVLGFNVFLRYFYDFSVVCSWFYKNRFGPRSSLGLHLLLTPSGMFLLHNLTLCGHACSSLIPNLREACGMLSCPFTLNGSGSCHSLFLRMRPIAEYDFSPCLLLCLRYLFAKCVAHAPFVVIEPYLYQS